MIWAVPVLLILAWVAGNALAPWVLVYMADVERMSMYELPAGLWRYCPRRTRVYRGTLSAVPDGRPSRPAAVTLWWPGGHIVVFDRLHYNPLSAPYRTRYLVAHEVAHIQLGHSRARWWGAVCGLTLLRSWQERLRQHEVAADEWATRMTGLTREQVRL